MGDHGSPNPSFRDLSHQLQAVPILFIAPGGQLVHLDHVSVDIGSSDKEDGIVGQGGHGEIRYADRGRRRSGHLVAVMDGGVAQGVRDDVKGRVVAGSGSCRSENRHRMNTELPRSGRDVLEGACLLTANVLVHRSSKDHQLSLGLSHSRLEMNHPCASPSQQPRTGLGRPGQVSGRVVEIKRVQDRVGPTGRGHPAETDELVSQGRVGEGMERRREERRSDEGLRRRVALRQLYEVDRSDQANVNERVRKWLLTLSCKTSLVIFSGPPFLSEISPPTT
jgi:hypothetical protein